MSNIAYTAPPTVLQAMHSDADIIGILGPPGGGKTAGALMLHLGLACRQPPTSKFTRKWCLGLGRSTNNQLSTSLVPSIQKWLPPELGDVTKSYPVRGEYIIPLPDNTTLELKLQGVSLEAMSGEDNLSGFEPSSILVDEADQVTEAMIYRVIERIGRYPSGETQCWLPKTTLTFNAVSTAHWLHKMMVKKSVLQIQRVDGTMYSARPVLFTQPPAVFIDNLAAVERDGVEPQYRLNAMAENLEHLPADYYAKQLSTSSLLTIRRRLGLEWLGEHLGKLVHPEFRRGTHMLAEAVTPLRGRPVIAGCDTSGVHPGIVIAQFINHRLTVTDVIADSVGFETFVRETLVPLRNSERYLGCPWIVHCDFADPKLSNTFTPTQVLTSYGFPAFTVATNDPATRRAALTRLLSTLDGFCVSPHCTFLIEALEQGFYYREIKGYDSGGNKMYGPTPVKNAHSHVAEAAEYLAMGVHSAIDNFNTAPATGQFYGRRYGV